MAEETLKLSVWKSTMDIEEGHCTWAEGARKTGIWAQSHTCRLCPLDVSSASLGLSLSQETETVLTISSSRYFFWKAYDKGHEDSWKTRKYCLNCKTSFIHSSYKRNHLYEGSRHLEGAVRGWLYESSHPLCRYHLILVVLIGPCTWNYIYAIQMVVRDQVLNRKRCGFVLIV